MRATTLCLFFVLVACPTYNVAHALRVCTKGNRELAAADYADWPRLVEAINDPSRVFRVWLNGNESFAYAGSTHDLNRVLRKFAETKAPRLEVILLPAGTDSRTVEDDIRADWRIVISGRLARDFAQGRRSSSMQPIHPTFTIYVTDRIDLSKVEIPPNVHVSQSADLRERYIEARSSDNERLKREATYLLEKLDANLQGEAAQQYSASLREIDEFVSRLP